MKPSWISKPDAPDAATITEFAIGDTEMELKSLASIKKTPYSESYMLIQKHHKEKARLLKEMEDWRKQEDKNLAQLGTEIFVFGTYLEGLQGAMAGAGLSEEVRGLSILQAKMVDLLSEYGVELINPTGQTLTQELRGQAQVFYVKKEGVTEPVVMETKEPLIHRRGKFVKAGVVIAAAPLDAGEQE
jgi:hypothetical protein